MQTTPSIEVLAFAGSLRTGSFNRALLRAAQSEAPDPMNVEIFDLAEVPLYDADVEAEGDPEAVAELKQAIGRADGVLIATPEYNFGMPAVTKNAVDWASRPPRASVLLGKPAGIIGASPGRFGTARAQTQLAQTLAACSALRMPQPGLMVSGAREKFDDSGNLTDDSTREYLRKYLQALMDWIVRLR